MKIGDLSPTWLTSHLWKLSRIKGFMQEWLFQMTLAKEAPSTRYVIFISYFTVHKSYWINLLLITYDWQCFCPWHPCWDSWTDHFSIVWDPMIAWYAYPLPGSCCQSHHSGLLASIDEADNQDENDYYELSQGEPIHYDIDADEEQTSLEAEGVDCGLISQLWKTCSWEGRTCNLWPKYFEEGVLSICILFYWYQEWLSMISYVLSQERSDLLHSVMVDSTR